MRTTIDVAGRLVIPKSVRDAAGIRPGMALEARYRDGRIEIEPAPADVSLVQRAGMTVVVYDDAPRLRAQDVLEAIDQVRSERVVSASRGERANDQGDID